MEDVERIESQIGQNLPIGLRKMFLEFSAGIEFGWVLPKGSSPPFSIYSGGFEGIKLAWLTRLEEERQGWIRHVFSDPTDPYSSKWYNKLAIISVINGDMIGIDLGNADGCVVYLSHEGDESLHGMILGRNFSEFMEYWSMLGCVGPEGWEIEPFVEGVQGINPLSVNASVWQKWLGLE
ncbi:MAG: SMI1/KNR4 family protein [Anaerolineae bacterium]|nr:SMI1/KNR4 family protein [Anaerolineae bacterium]